MALSAYRESDVSVVTYVAGRQLTVDSPMRVAARLCRVWTTFRPRPVAVWVTDQDSIG
jgi:hypothetical protein